LSGKGFAGSNLIDVKTFSGFLDIKTPVI
jgi:hypothetical protein